MDALSWSSVRDLSTYQPSNGLTRVGARDAYASKNITEGGANKAILGV